MRSMWCRVQPREGGDSQGAERVTEGRYVMGVWVGVLAALSLQMGDCCLLSW